VFKSLIFSNSVTMARGLSHLRNKTLAGLKKEGKKKY
jgi:hypothetical protein